MPDMDGLAASLAALYIHCLTDPIRVFRCYNSNSFRNPLHQPHGAEPNVCGSEQIITGHI